jgi:hypothetical protein
MTAMYLVFVTTAIAVSACGMSATEREIAETGCGRQKNLIEKLDSDEPVDVQQCVDDTTCKRLGFKPGTPEYGNCRLQREQLRETRATRSAVETGTAVQIINQD